MLEWSTTFMTKDKEKHVPPMLDNSETLAAFNLTYAGLIARSVHPNMEGRHKKIRWGS